MINLQLSIVRGKYAGKPIARRPRAWCRRFKGYGQQPACTIYNFSVLRVWFLLVVEK